MTLRNTHGIQARTIAGRAIAGDATATPARRRARTLRTVGLLGATLQRSSGNRQTSLRLPDAAEQRQRAERHQPADDVHELGADVVAPRRTARRRTRRRTRAPPASTPRRPRHPLIVTTSQAGTISDTNGSWRPAIALSVVAGNAGDGRERQDRRADRAEGDRRRVGDEREAGGVERREAEPHQQRRADRDRACRTRTRPR